jgi:hypothetical protein
VRSGPPACAPATSLPSAMTTPPARLAELRVPNVLARSRGRLSSHEPASRARRIRA